MSDGLSRVRVWDLPTRLFHWLLAACVFGSLGSAWIGGNAMVWHLRLGFTVLALLVFRILWGLVGGRWSRFASFVFAPATLARYLRGQSRAHELHHVGHNPLGAISVFAFLALLALQVGTGLVADDEIATTGPLNRFVSGATASLATHWHKDYGQWLILVLVVLHVGAILYYGVRRRDNLLRPMLTGDKRLAQGIPGSTDTPRSRLLALVLIGACAAAVTWIVRLGG